jgi:hypothetical protein
MEMGDTVYATERDSYRDFSGVSGARTPPPHYDPYHDAHYDDREYSYGVARNYEYTPHTPGMHHHTHHYDMQSSPHDIQGLQELSPWESLHHTTHSGSRSETSIEHREALMTSVKNFLTGRDAADLLEARLDIYKLVDAADAPLVVHGKPTMRMNEGPVAGRAVFNVPIQFRYEGETRDQHSDALYHALRNFLHGMSAADREEVRLDIYKITASVQPAYL